MDRLNFRAWDSKEKCWISGFAIHQSGLFSDMCKDNKQYWYDEEQMKNIVIEQCTGLKDKNGKLIFEGDKVKVTYHDINPFDEYSLAIVKWMDDVSYPAFDLEFYQGNDSFDCNAFSWIFESGDYDIEIISTIHDKEVCING